MAIPTDYVFKTGTCLKSELYGKMIDALKAAGWEDISSNPATDFVVLHSKGNTGDKNLILNLRPGNTSNANPVDTTDYCQMSYRLQNSYTPGASGAAGTFGRPSLAWTALYIVPAAAAATILGASTTLNYYVYADASKVILMVQYPSATGYLPMLIYLGEPDTLYTPESDGRGILAAMSANNPTGNNTVQICDNPDQMASAAAPYVLTVYALLAPGDPNADSKSFLSSVYYGSAAEGYRGKLDGVKLVYFSGSNFVTGDTITVGREVYTVFIVAATGYTSFPSRGLAIRTA
jgi:hypothetical protein